MDKKAEKILAIDLGNTNVALGLFSGENLDFRIIKGADHNFVMPGMTDELIRLLSEWLEAPGRPWESPAPGIRQRAEREPAGVAGSWKISS